MSCSWRTSRDSFCCWHFFGADGQENLTALPTSSFFSSFNFISRSLTHYRQFCWLALPLVYLYFIRRLMPIHCRLWIHHYDVVICFAASMTLWLGSLLITPTFLVLTEYDHYHFLLSNNDNQRSILIDPEHSCSSLALKLGWHPSTLAGLSNISSS